MNGQLALFLVATLSAMLAACGESSFVAKDGINVGQGRSLKGDDAGDAGDYGDTDAADSDSDGGYDSDDDSSGKGGIDSDDDAAGMDAFGGDEDHFGLVKFSTRNLCSNAGERKVGDSVQKSSGVSVKLMNADTRAVEDLAGDATTIREKLLDNVGVALRPDVADGSYYILLCDAAAASCSVAKTPDEAGMSDIKQYFLKNGKSISALGISESPITIQDGEIVGSLPPVWTVFDERRKDSSASDCDENSSPLMFDFSGQGFALSAPSVDFDVEAIGQASRISWMSNASQMLLALDINGNGQIDNGNELFGNNTLLADGTKAANGFAALAQYDDNRNGVIDAGDQVFALLRLWSDKNTDGHTDAGELMTLSTMTVASIALDYDVRTERDQYGNLFKERSTATRTDGSQVQVVDVWFKLGTTLAAR